MAPPITYGKKKLKNVKNNLKNWVKTSYREPQRVKTELQKEMGKIQEKAKNMEETKENGQREKEFHWDIYKNNRKEEEYRLKSRQLWIQAG